MEFVSFLVFVDWRFAILEDQQRQSGGKYERGSQASRRGRGRGEQFPMVLIRI